MQSPGVPEPDDIARLLGLKDWRAGAHRFAGATSVWAHALWWVEAEPSFHPHWVVAGVAASEWREGAPLWRKAALAQGSAVGVVDLPEAAVEEAFNAAPLLRSSFGLSLDGIGYSVRTDSIPVHAEFRFANPEVAEWVAVERALLAVGTAAAKAGGSAELAAVMKLWRSYAGSR